MAVRTMQEFRHFLDARSEHFKGFMSAKEFESRYPERFMRAYLKWSGADRDRGWKEREERRVEIENQRRRSIVDRTRYRRTHYDWIVELKSEPCRIDGQESEFFFNVLGVAKDGSMTVIKESVHYSDLRNVLVELKGSIESSRASGSRKTKIKIYMSSKKGG